MDEYIPFITGMSDYKIALEIVRANSEGQIFLIGGTVYRTLAAAHHHRQIAQADIDFLVERRSKEITVPHPWSWQSMDYDGMPLWSTDERNNIIRFNVPGIKIDVISMTQLCTRTGQPATLNDYLNQVPLTVQSIAFDINHDKIWGEIGVHAILDQKVAVNNLEQAERSAKIHGVTIEEYIAEKAAELGFSAVLPQHAT